ncbi:hypothetical protein AB1N83_011779 [Pleurotus pulmonarius]
MLCAPRIDPIIRASRYVPKISRSSHDLASLEAGRAHCLNYRIGERRQQACAHRPTRGVDSRLVTRRIKRYIYYAHISALGTRILDVQLCCSPR